MGESFVALAEGPETILYNPAGLVLFSSEKFEKSKKSEVPMRKQVYTASGLLATSENIKHGNICYSQGDSKTAWGLQAGILYVSGLTETVADPTTADGFRETGNFSA